MKIYVVTAEIDSEHHISKIFLDKDKAIKYSELLPYGYFDTYNSSDTEFENLLDEYTYICAYLYFGEETTYYYEVHIDEYYKDIKQLTFEPLYHTDLITFKLSMPYNEANKATTKAKYEMLLNAMKEDVITLKESSYSTYDINIYLNDKYLRKQ